MAEMGLRPDRGHVKSARVVGEVMGKLHPHGDGAIYDALVRLAQPFTMRLPLVDGHGNFGSLDAGPAAARYTEARPAPAATLLTAGLDEGVVDTVDNYDGSLQQPEVLPAAYPNLLVNGASGIAVGMATNMPPHNLAEVVAAARYLVRHPQATTADLGRFVPGPDFPTGGIVVGLDGVREAYETGRGAFRVRGRVQVEAVTARRKGLVVTELPYGVGPERLIEKIKDSVQAKKLDGIAALTDLSDRTRGMRVVVELKSGFDPEAVLQQLYRQTPLEEAFSVNAVALVEGRPRTLGLRDLLGVYVDFRLDVVRRRTAHRLAVAERELHLVEGLLVAVLDIDEVIQVIRTSDDTGVARDRLVTVFELSQTQAEHILEMRLRRLTRFSTIELETRRDELRERIEGLTALLGSDERLRDTVCDELDAVVAAHGTPRRTVLLEGGEVPAPRGRTPLVALEVADEPCRVLWGATGLLARTADLSPLGVPRSPRDRSRHDAMLAAVTTSARAHVGVVTSTGRLVRLPVVDLPALPSTAAPVSLSGGVSVSEAAGLAAGERVVGLVDLSPSRPGAGPGLVTARGVVKRVLADAPPGREEWEVVRLADGDEVVAAFDVADADELVIVADDGSLLRFGAGSVRPQGTPRGRHGRHAARRRRTGALRRGRGPGPGRRRAQPGSGRRGRSRSGRGGRCGRCGRRRRRGGRGDGSRQQREPAGQPGHVGQGDALLAVPRPRAAGPAGCGCTVSSRARTCSSPPGWATGPPWPPGRRASRSRCRRRTGVATARAPAPAARCRCWAGCRGDLPRPWRGPGGRRRGRAVAALQRRRPAPRRTGRRHGPARRVVARCGRARLLAARATDRLPPQLRAALAAAPAVRALLVRPVGRQHSDVGVLLAGTRPGRSWLREVDADGTPDVLAELAADGSRALASLGAGRDPGLGRRAARPAVLVCTNGARDACCAREGRPAAALLQARLAPGRRGLLARGPVGADVWEASHLGGHRFAPTAVVLPHGVLLGGLGPEPEPLADAVEGVLAGRTVLDGYRGRSTWATHEQAAETAVRRHLAVVGVNAGPDDVVVDGSRGRGAGVRSCRGVVAGPGTAQRRPDLPGPRPPQRHGARTSGVLRRRCHAGGAVGLRGGPGHRTGAVSRGLTGGRCGEGGCLRRGRPSGGCGDVADPAGLAAPFHEPQAEVEPQRLRVVDVDAEPARSSPASR
jgi:DNA gyrase subunit A